MNPAQTFLICLSVIFLMGGSYLFGQKQNDTEHPPIYQIVYMIICLVCFIIMATGCVTSLIELIVKNL